jgi:hypothetical protein
MRFLFRFFVGALIVVVALVAGGTGWFFLYSGDLPGLKGVTKFAPATAVTVVDECNGKPVLVVPYTKLGINLQLALIAAEAPNPDRASQVFAGRIAMNSFCTGSRMLKRHLQEWRASNQLHLKLTPDELLTIYANKAYFGDGLIGVETASQHFYGKHASELDVAQAAMIAGMLKAPRLYSPELRPERAKQRRDQVIDAMVTQGAITTSQAEAAKAMPVHL